MEKQAEYDVPSIRATLLAKMGDKASAYPTEIEKTFPRILAVIADLWGTAELDAYLETLMLPTRVDRQGFPVPVATEVFRLTTLHYSLGLAPKKGEIGWAGVEQSAFAKKLDS